MCFQNGECKPENAGTNTTSVCAGSKLFKAPIFDPELYEERIAESPMNVCTCNVVVFPLPVIGEVALCTISSSKQSFSLSHRTAYPA